MNDNQQELDRAIDWATYMAQEDWRTADIHLNIAMVTLGACIGIMLMMLLLLWGVL